jgi:hypothetical protein
MSKHRRLSALRILSARALSASIPFMPGKRTDTRMSCYGGIKGHRGNEADMKGQKEANALRINTPTKANALSLAYRAQS